MRIEQIIAVVARFAVAEVREIRRVVSFVATCLHRAWQMRMLLGLLPDTGSPTGSFLRSSIDSSRSYPFGGNKRGNRPFQLCLATAACPAEAATAFGRRHFHQS